MSAPSMDNTPIVNNTGSGQVDNSVPPSDITFSAGVNKDVETPKLHNKIETVRNLPDTTSIGTKLIDDHHKVTVVKNLYTEFKAAKKENSKALNDIKWNSILIKTAKIAGGILMGIGALAVVGGLTACAFGQIGGAVVALVGVGLVIGGGTLASAAPSPKYTKEERAQFESNVKNLKESLDLMEKYPKGTIPNGGSFEEFLNEFDNKNDSGQPSFELGKLNHLTSLYKLTRLENDHQFVYQDIENVEAQLDDLELQLFSDLSKKEKKEIENKQKELTAKLRDLNEELSLQANPKEVSELRKELETKYNKLKTGAAGSTIANVKVPEAKAPVNSGKDEAPIDHRTLQDVPNDHQAALGPHADRLIQAPLSSQQISLLDELGIEFKENVPFDPQPFQNKIDELNLEVSKLDNSTHDSDSEALEALQKFDQAEELALILSIITKSQKSPIFNTLESEQSPKATEKTPLEELNAKIAKNMRRRNEILFQLKKLEIDPLNATFIKNLEDELVALRRQKGTYERMKSKM